MCGTLKPVAGRETTTTKTLGRKRRQEGRKKAAGHTIAFLKFGIFFSTEGYHDLTPTMGWAVLRAIYIYISISFNPQSNPVRSVRLLPTSYGGGRLHDLHKVIQ